MSGIRYLSDIELDELVQEIDEDSNGFITYEDVESQLDKTYYDLQPEAKAHHLHHASKDKARHEFLRYVLGTDNNKIGASEFKAIVKSWNIPSVEQEKQKKREEKDYLKKIAAGRRLRAIWQVKGPEYGFVALVIASQLALGTWQCWKYSRPQYQAAFGPGLAFAKFSAGALYPTLFFLLLSMSRWFQTWIRNFHFSRFINFDKSQSFHIYISVCLLAFSTFHSVGHLSGTFVYGSEPDRQQAVTVFLGPGQQRYVDYIRSVAGWTGLVSLAIIYTISLLSLPFVRRKSYQIFQLGHLLMFPLLALMAAHGSDSLLQFPVLGIILVIPATLIILERSNRFLSAFRQIPAKMEILDEDTVTITCTIPKSRLFWRYEPGQYVLLCVPQISRFQWHPFTISTCDGRDMQLHIKTSAGDWTSSLRTLQMQHVAIDGPYGAPAQRFYDFDQTIIIGSGIGVTPFSGILNDLRAKDRHRQKSYEQLMTENIISNEATEPQAISQPHVSAEHLTNDATLNDKDLFGEEHKEDKFNPYRSDFHWIVRDQNHLLWFSSLLNELSTHHSHIDVRLHPHLTTTLKDPSISLHVYRCLLEMHRTELQPVSPLTGLIASTQFGRPDFPKIFHEHYLDMLNLYKTRKDKSTKRQIGVFFCGSPLIGAQLADLCREMTLQGREDGTGVEYHFQIEVFG